MTKEYEEWAALTKNKSVIEDLKFLNKVKKVEHSATLGSCDKKFYAIQQKKGNDMLMNRNGLKGSSKRSQEQGRAPVIHTTHDFEEDYTVEAVFDPDYACVSQKKETKKKLSLIMFVL